MNYKAQIKTIINTNTTVCSDFNITPSYCKFIFVSLCFEYSNANILGDKL